MRLVMLGPPGAGKGTQATRIAKAYGVPHIATGDIFRMNVRDGTELGRSAKAYMDRGELVPDDVVIGMVDQRLGEPDAQRGFVLDGFPRTVPQAAALEERLVAAGRPLDVVLNIEVPEEDIVRRITRRRVCTACGAVYHLDFQPPAREGVCDVCGGALAHREDDTEGVVRTRLQEYRSKTEPLERYYGDRRLLRRVHGVGEVEDVTKRLLAVLEDVDDGDAA